jgi:hypothetical protein
MRISRLSGLALAAALLLAPLAVAQTPQVEITDMRLGFPGSINAVQRGGAKPGRFKIGAWAPLYVDLAVKPDSPPLKRDEYVLVVETTDSEDLQNVYVEHRFLPTIEPRESPTLLTYVRVGNGNSEVRVKVQQVKPRPDGTVELDKVLRDKKLTQADLNPMPPHVYGYLTLGGKVSSLYKALVSTQQKAGVGVGGGVIPPPAGGPPPEGGENEPPDPEENGNRSFAHLDQVQQMPTYWFGYQPIDTAVLLTSKPQFATDLSSAGKDDPFSVRRDALAEWVRRGGHLIISVSKNHQEVNQILEQMKIIDLAVEGRVQLTGLPGVARWAGLGEFRGVVTKDQKTPLVEVAKLKPGRGVQVLAYDRVNGADPEARPMIVQSACGLGRVIVVGFDLDEQPFTGWKGREEFWKRIKEINEPSNIGDGLRQDRFNNWRAANDGTQGELGGKLVKSLEAFPDVPVISFGWVALFILVYILIVGPLDYFFLKKVVKRLELTWITFPAVVIVISAVAYFAAYHLKGKDLRINKVDVVDVDLSGGNVYGNTWFTLFSPRIQNYTVGVEPGTGWGPEERDPRKYGPFVGWMGKPDEGFYAYGGRGSPGLFRRAYDYAPESSGLVGVPIQVWSTKTFSASWARPIKEDELVEARLEVAKNDETGMKLSGTITSHLPVDLRDAVLFYRGKYYPLEKLTAGTPLRVDGKMGQAGDPQVWFNQQLGQPFQAANNRRLAGADLPQPVGSYIKSVLFHTYPGDNTQQNARNSGLRFLDQKWRLDVNYRDEAIVFGRAEPPAGGAAEGNADEISKSGLSASKMWLGKLPGGGDRPRIDGTLSQDTYVRVFIPVKR